MVASQPTRHGVESAVRPILFYTGIDEFQYATHGGTAFIVSYKGRPYAVTCRHVFGDFKEDQLTIFGAQSPKTRDKSAKIKTVCYPSSPQAAAAETDVIDLCLIEFHDDVSTGFFNETAYSLSEETICSSVTGDRLLIFGVLKDKTWIEPPDINVGHCRLELSDDGAASDPFLRKGAAIYAGQPFSTVTGISGSPVFNHTRNGLCGMVLRGGLSAGRLSVLYAEAFDILRFVEAVSEGKPDTFYVKHPTTRPNGVWPDPSGR